MPPQQRSRFGSRWDPDTDEIRNPEPYDYAGAKRAHARASRDMTAAADFRVDCAEKFAEARKAYQSLFAKRVVELMAGSCKGYPKMAATAAVEVARGLDDVAEAREKKDVAEGMKEAAEQLAWKASADRRGLEQLVAWSMKVAPDGQFPEGWRP